MAWWLFQRVLVPSRGHSAVVGTAIPHGERRHSRRWELELLRDLRGDALFGVHDETSEIGRKI